MAKQLINGTEYTWSQLIITIDSIPYAEIRALNFTVSQEKTNTYGIGANPTGRGRGRKTFEGSISISLGDIESLRQTAPNGDLLDLPPFSITASWIPKTGGNLPINKVLQNCEFTEDSLTTEEGSTETTIELPFIFAGIK